MIGGGRCQDAVGGGSCQENIRFCPVYTAIGSSRFFFSLLIMKFCLYTAYMKIELVLDALNELLSPGDFARADNSMNGLQVGRRSGDVAKAAFAVDACMESFQGAADAGADMLIVHHGLFWGKPLAVTGTHYARLAYLIEHDLALYASHLPLDAHPEIGNNAGLARQLGLTNLEPFGEYRGVMIGMRGELSRPETVESILTRLGIQDEETVSILPFGPPVVRNIGVVSGGAAEDVLEAIDKKLDMYITGEPSHQVYHACLEAGIHMVAAGHYFTETFGPKLLAERIARETGLDTCFIDHPTGL